jgi:hypothetical protein
VGTKVGKNLKVEGGNLEVAFTTNSPHRSHRHLGKLALLCSYVTYVVKNS